MKVLNQDLLLTISLGFLIKEERNKSLNTVNRRIKKKNAFCSFHAFWTAAEMATVIFQGPDAAEFY